MVEQASVRVVDVFGKLIEEHSVTNTDKHVLKRENKASGIYFMEIEVEQKEKAIYKLIIE
ncbi:MAG: T9SS type A sorting domain-containing protein [Flavobacteriales bacterium]|nr:T9SS type A sorting domain-containing protein [Flavobacteriales bacterium]